MFKKRFVALLLAVLMVFSLVGCNSKAKNTDTANTATQAPTQAATQEAQATPTQGPATELTWYMPGGAQTGLQEVEDACNAITVPLINAKIKLVFVDWATYEQTMNTMYAANEPFDMCFTSNWTNNYYTNAAAGAFYDITDLLQKEAPNSYARVPELAWNGVKVNGKTYGLVNYQVWGFSQARGFQVLQSLADKYQLDWKNVKSYSDLTPFLEQVKAGEPGMIPAEYPTDGGYFTQNPLFYGFDNLGSADLPGWLDMSDSSKFSVVNQYESKAFADYIAMARDWYNKGLFRQDAATFTDVATDRKAAKEAIAIAYAYPDTALLEPPVLPKFSNSDPTLNAYVYQKSLTDSYLPASGIATAIEAIGANSKNPELALKYLELVNTNADLFNTLAWGIEGRDYTVNKDYVAPSNATGQGGWDASKCIYLNPDAKYNTGWGDWEFGQGNGRLWYVGDQSRSQADETAQAEYTQKQCGIVAEADKSGPKSPAMGFVFDSTPVQTQVANVTAVIRQYLDALCSGSVDPDKILPEFIDKLKAAGVDDVIAEKQKQIDAWAQVNGISR